MFGRRQVLYCATSTCTKPRWRCSRAAAPCEYECRAFVAEPDCLRGWVSALDPVCLSRLTHPLCINSAFQTAPHPFFIPLRSARPVVYSQHSGASARVAQWGSTCRCQPLYSRCIEIQLCLIRFMVRDRGHGSEYTSKIMTGALANVTPIGVPLACLAKLARQSWKSILVLFQVRQGRYRKGQLYKSDCIYDDWPGSHNLDQPLCRLLLFYF